MPRLLRISNAIDRFSERFGRMLSWLTLVMVVVGSFNAIVRYFDRYTGFGLSSNTYLELQWYLFSLVFLLGAAYTLKHDAHVRVDILFSRLGERGQAIVNLAGVILFLIPFCVLMIIVAWPAVYNSWSVLEMSPDPGGLPRYLIKSVIPIGFLLILAQGVSMGIHQIDILFRLQLDKQDGREDLD
ncbi:MAG: TRAP transporter small permease subunit [Rhodothermia bacterium]|nr:MAG: TRAP transporter small permease subunit [Rhodothermia bacterium]